GQPRPVVAVRPEPPPPPAPALTQSKPVEEAKAEPSAEPANEEPPPPVAPTAVTLAIRSITIGQSKALVLESGERVFEGATLPGGYVVKSISADSVVLERMGETSVVSVGASK
ncbi:MAG TPA: hypothetical protein VM510_17500, partial [Caulifigura sp.]|nr:hypothetical protein [Caulifigura sp.]